MALDAKVVWKNGLAFTGSANSGFTVDLDSDIAVGGSNSGLRPMELVAIGIAGCTAMDVISILEKKRQEVTAFEVKVTAQRAPEHPKRFTDVEIEYVVTGRNLDPAAVERAVELSENKYCSAIATMRGCVNFTRKITLHEAQA
ncbi:OsmC family protein [uncultured Thermanaerothrix sp.]|uniref:OsmC family protein n=1 Tax=uncultured Thermanaerothrix sp. TaxID=1195149 RepID=UPI00260AF5EA|nr:OsmC family protein [uncultured Thermanaerothrix sp.]